MFPATTVAVLGALDGGQGSAEIRRQFFQPRLAVGWRQVVAQWLS